MIKCLLTSRSACHVAFLNATTALATWSECLVSGMLCSCFPGGSAAAACRRLVKHVPLQSHSLLLVCLLANQTVLASLCSASHLPAENRQPNVILLHSILLIWCNSWCPLDTGIDYAGYVVGFKQGIQV